MRGGVSLYELSHDGELESSPHAWGCFHSVPTSWGTELVFPTCVGVFPFDFGTTQPVMCLPHMRGGVSMQGFRTFYRSWSSPHAWGCFSSAVIASQIFAVFPTCVGVFLRARTLISNPASLPHMRGGVS